MRETSDQSRLFEALRETSPEISIDQIDTMVKAFPAAPALFDWTNYINLNSILMTSIGAIIVAGSFSFFAGETSTSQLEIKEYQIEVQDELACAPLGLNESPASPLDTEENEPKNTSNQSAPQTMEPLEPAILDCTPHETIGGQRDIAPVDPITEEPDARIQESRSTFDYSGFNSISLVGSIDVIISQGEFSISAEGEAEDIEMIDMSMSGGTLRIKEKKRNASWTWNNWKDRSVFIYVRMPDIDKLELVGSGDIEIQRFSELDHIEIRLSGSGDIISTEHLDFSGEVTLDLAGSGDIELKGSCHKVTASVAGSGDIDALQLNARSGQASVAGSGDISVNCTEDLDIKIAGSGDVTYKGSARVTQSIIGSGDVNRY